MTTLEYVALFSAPIGGAIIAIVGYVLTTPRRAKAVEHKVPARD